MKYKAWAVAALVSAASWSMAAHANTVILNFDGQGVAANLTLTYGPNSNTGPIGTQPNTYDPVGSYVITSVTGTFSDSNAGLGISNATVTGLVPINPATPADPINLLAPHSFSFFSSGLTYDNLYYPFESPGVATNYPFGGGVLDIYGLMFHLDDGHYVNLWSNGVPPGGSLNYGVAVSSTDTTLDYANGLDVSVDAVPEPATWTILVLGVAGMGGALRLRKKGSADLAYAA